MPQQEERTLPQPQTAADIVARLVNFDGPPHEFLRYLVGVQCRLASAEAGAILRPAAEGEMQVLTSYPPVAGGGPLPPWLTQSAEAALSVMQGGKTGIFPVHDSTDLYGEAPRRWLIVLPIRHTGRVEVRGAASFLLATRDAAEIRDRQERLELSLALLSLYEMQLSSQLRQADMRRLRDAMEVVAATNQQDRFVAMGVALCNEFCSRWSCQRASIGFLRGRGIKLTHISHTENFSRKMQLVQDLESAMEECLDQDVEIIYPASNEATFVARSAGKLSDRHGPVNICSFPLRQGGKVVGVLTVERARDNPFDQPMLEAMRLAADLVTPRLNNLHEHDRWFGAKAAAGIRKGAAAAVGPKHTWIKLAVIAVAALAAFLFLVDGDYNVDSPVTVQAINHQVVAAPFQGLLETVDVDLGQQVASNQLLGKFKTYELERKLAEAKADKIRYQTDYDKSSSEGKTAEAQQAKLKADQAQQQIEILEEQIGKAELHAPFDGFVVSGDVKNLRGNTYPVGQPLFEVAPLDALRGELRVDERDIHQVKLGQKGELATAGHPGIKLAFEVEAISPIAESIEGKNVFKVRVKLLDGQKLDEAMYWLRPGMEGVAKVSIDRRKYAWIWTHRAVEWVRLKLWQYGFST